MRKINGKMIYKTLFKFLSLILFPLVKLAGLIYFLVGKSWTLYKKSNRGYWNRLGINKEFRGWFLFFEGTPKAELLVLPAYLVYGIAYFMLMAFCILHVILAPWFIFLEFVVPHLSNDLADNLSGWFFFLQFIWFGIFIDYRTVIADYKRFK